MKTHFSISELLNFNISELPKSERGVQKKVQNENWNFIEVPGRGGRNGKRREYAPPPEVMAQIRAKLSEKVLADLAGQPAAVLPAPRPPSTGAAVQTAGTAVAPLPTYAGTTAAQRNREGARRSVLDAVERLMAESGAGKEAAIVTLLTQASMPQFAHVAQMFRAALDERGSGETRLPSVRTVKRWFAQREEGSLVPKTAKGDLDMPPWLPLFLKFYRIPTKPSVELAYEAFVGAVAAEMPHLAKIPSIHSVRRALAKVGRVALQEGRKGPRDLKNDLPFKRREFLHLPPAAIYTADGHTFDAEVLNPLSGRPFRPEITTVVDVATRRCMGWSVGLAESRFTVLEALCHASLTAVGAIWYVDWGKGFENLMMTDEATGVMGRLGMTMKHSRAYNSQAKGASERSHNIFTRAARKLASYVGKDMDQEARKALYHWSRQEIKLQGKIIRSPIPTWDAFKDFIEREITAYNDRPHRSLPKFTDDAGKRRHMSPNEMWALKVAEFGAPPKVAPEDAAWLFRPQVMRTVARGEVSLFNNTYFSRDLEEWNGETLRVGYDVQDAQFVWLYDDEGRLVAKAEWRGNSQGYMPVSVIDQAMDKRNDAALKRVEVKRDHVLAERRTPLIEHQPSVNIGGLVLDMADLKREAEKLSALPLAAEDAAVSVQPSPRPSHTEERVKAVLPEPVWEAPDSNNPQAQYKEYRRLTAMSSENLTAEQQRWLEWYQNSGRIEVMEQMMRAYG